MIRINLLPSGKKKVLVLPPTILYGMIAVVIAVIAVIGLTFYLNKQISAKQADIEAKDQKLKKIQAALVEVKNYERDNKEYRDKTMVIEQLKKNQIVPLRLLDEVSEMLPKGVWLTGMKDKSGIVSIDGYAFTNSDLVAYVQSLKGSRYLADVMLVESRQTDLAEFSVYKFKLTFKVKV
ncbi:MAG: PilN domain-containing protein [Nitrospiraceae bacterium]|nr:MAG: PilN domain-containing protein [Nitrospiraceae bacterium]